LLAEAGYSFTAIPPHDDEPKPLPHELAETYVMRLAYLKAADVARSLPAGLVIGCDTVVECGSLILGKPTDRPDARRILHTLSGREHRVVSGLCLWDIQAGHGQLRAAETKLRMDPLDEQVIEEYLDSGQWVGKAGAFGYQDRIGWVHILEGSESNVVGLPLELLAEMLQEFASS